LPLPGILTPDYHARSARPLSPGCYPGRKKQTGPGIAAPYLRAVGDEMADKRHITLIWLRPDGSNRTWLLTRSRIALLISLVVAGVCVAAGLLYWAYWNQRRYSDLADRYDLLAGREVLALSPQPTPVDSIPGAAQLPAEAAMIPGTAQDPASVNRQPSSLPSRTPSPAMEPAAETGRQQESPVRIVGFQIEQVEPGAWEISADLTKSEQDGEVLRGFVTLVIEDLSRPGEFITQPPMTLREGRPITPQAGTSFAIRRFRPMSYRIEPPEGFRIGTVRFVVYDRNGVLLLEQVFDAGSGSAP